MRQILAISITACMLGGCNADLTATPSMAAPATQNSPSPAARALLPAPTHLNAAAVSASQIDLTWTDMSSEEANFNLMYSTDAGFAEGVRRSIAANATFYSHTALNPATTYWYQIKANGYRMHDIGTASSAWSAPDFATTTPGSLDAIAISGSAIDLAWVGNGGNPNITGYTLQYATNPEFGGAQYRYVGASAVTAFRMSGLNAGQCYYFKIKAEGTSDTFDSPFSAATSTTTLPTSQAGLAISPRFFGINAWLPKYIAGVDRGGKLETKLCGAAYTRGGQCVPAEIAASGVQTMRYGGIAIDKNFSDALSPSEYLLLVDNMRVNHIEPVLQVPYNLGQYSTTQAANLVRYINIEMARGVKNWTIANEPNWGDYHWNASQIAPYFRRYAQAMKEVDPSIVITGPDLAFYDATIMTELTTFGGPHDITGSFTGSDGSQHYYIDILNFHTYPFDGNPETQTRQKVIDQPSGGFQENITALKARVDLANDKHHRTGDSALRMAVTEMNVDWHNPSYSSAHEVLAGVGAPSFLAGQYWADAMSVGMKNGLAFMTFWSAIEGSAGLSYIASDGTRLPTYFHFQMLAQNFRGNYVSGTTLVNDAAGRNVKAFGAKASDQIVVMILNQSYDDLSYTVRLDTGAVSGTNALKINLDAGVAREYNDPRSEPIKGQSSMLLVLDASGTLRERHRYVIGDTKPEILND